MMFETDMGRKKWKIDPSVVESSDIYPIVEKIDVARCYLSEMKSQQDAKDRMKYREMFAQYMGEDATDAWKLDRYHSSCEEESRRNVFKSLSELESPYFEVLWLRYVEGKDQEWTAWLLDVDCLDVYRIENVGLYKLKVYNDA